MLIRNATRADVESALESVNAVFSGNVEFKRFDYAGQTREGGEKWNVTLTVASSFAPGARRGQSGRRMRSACWHVHGTFIDSLPWGCEIVTSLGGRHVTHPGARWQDTNIGSMWRPLYASSACDCGK